MADGIDPSAVGSGSTQVAETKNKYNNMFSNEAKDNLDQADFLKLMVEQLKNQDFQNPTDNTQFIAQMAQFTTLQSQQEATYYSQATYATSLVGKKVAVSGTTASGRFTTEVGMVTSVRLTDNKFLYTVNGKEYDAKNIMEVGVWTKDDVEEPKPEDPDKEDPDGDGGEHPDIDPPKPETDPKPEPTA